MAGIRRVVFFPVTATWQAAGFGVPGGEAKAKATHPRFNPHPHAPWKHSSYSGMCSTRSPSSVGSHTG